MASNSNLSEEELIKIQEEKEKILNEIKGNSTTTTESVQDAFDTTDNFESLDNSIDPELSDDLTPKKKSTTMPRYGNGFKFVPIISGITLLGIILGHIKPFNVGVSASIPLRYIYLGLGIIIAIFGLFIFVESISSADILTNAQMGKLITTGIYSKTRNPMYGGVLFMCTGALFCSGNTFMYVLPLIYWWLLGTMMKNTEEPLLLSNFGEEYREYFDNTNRVFPFKKK